MSTTINIYIEFKSERQAIAFAKDSENGDIEQTKDAWRVWYKSPKLTHAEQAIVSMAIEAVKEGI